MAKQTINLGTGPNTKTGDPLRTAFTKINQNFDELYAGASIGATGPQGVAGATGPSGGGIGDGGSITLTNLPYYASVLNTPYEFTRPNGQPNTVDAIDEGLTIKRGGNNGIFNSESEGSWNSNQSPLGTEWNADGWATLETEDVTQRTFTTFYNASGNAVGENVVNYEYVMHDTINDKYYKVDFKSWQPGGGGGAGSGVDSTGGFSYVRTEIDTTVVKYFNRAFDNDITDDIDTDLSIGRDSQGGIYNRAVEEQWDADVTPTGTLWNSDGWNDLSNLSDKTWKPFFAAVHGQLGNHVIGLELLMWDTVNDKYYKIKFSDWGQNNGGSFAYTRRRIKATNTEEGIYFADGTVQKTAYSSATTSGLKFDKWSYPDPAARIRHENPEGSVLVQTTSGGRSALRWHIRLDPNNGPSTYSQVVTDDDGIHLANADWSNTRGGAVHNWHFNWDGNLILPNGGSLGLEGMGWVGLSNGTSNQPVSIINKRYDGNWRSAVNLWHNDNIGYVEIIAANIDTETTYAWTYKQDGSMQFPYVPTNNRTGYGDGILFAKTNNQKVISTSAGNVDYQTVERLVIAGGDSYFDGTNWLGEAGDLYLWAGRGANGGDIKVDAGNSLGTSGEEGGTIKIRGGSSSSGTGGFVEIHAGTGSVNGEIRLYAGNNQWTIHPDNYLQLPASADIKNSDGYSVIKSIPQNLQSAATDYTLSITDGGKHIYKNDGEAYGVVVPTNESVAFEIGTAITIVSGDSWTYIYAADAMTTEVWGAGFNTTSTSFYIPNNSMATLLKIDTDKWMLSGAGLAID